MVRNRARIAITVAARVPHHGEREKQARHSSIQVTFDTHGHLFPNSRETAAKKLQQAMFTGRKNGFGSNLVAKPGKPGKRKPKPENGQ